MVWLARNRFSRFPSALSGSFTALLIHIFCISSRRAEVAAGWVGQWGRRGENAQYRRPTDGIWDPLPGARGSYVADPLLVALTYTQPHICVHTIDGHVGSGKLSLAGRVRQKYKQAGKTDRHKCKPSGWIDRHRYTHTRTEQQTDTEIHTRRQSNRQTQKQTHADIATNRTTKQQTEQKYTHPDIATNRTTTTAEQQTDTEIHTRANIRTNRHNREGTYGRTHFIQKKKNYE